MEKNKGHDKEIMTESEIQGQVYNGQSEQDKFVLKSLKFKKDGTFVEIGSNHPQKINNTYPLEIEYNWTGIMIEYEEKFLDRYKRLRPNSHHVIADARTIEYLELFEKCNMPFNIDYLQIDIDAENYSTLNTLEQLDKTVLDKYKFATVTYEHDIYRSIKRVRNKILSRDRVEDNREEIRVSTILTPNADVFRNTRRISREIFEKRGYKRVFSDVKNGNCPYEDWYAHPELVDIEYITGLQAMNKNTYILDFSCDEAIPWRQIRYPKESDMYHVKVSQRDLD